MASSKLRGKHLIHAGYPQGKVVGLAINAMITHFKRMPLEKQLKLLKQVLAAPAEYIDDAALGTIARELIPDEKEEKKANTLLLDKIPYRTYGASQIEQSAVDQMDTAMRLPVTVAGALMPDAHQGFGLPIGGVLATENVVIPYAVGVDIGCRMCMSIYELPASYAENKVYELKQLLSENTRFGNESGFSKPIDNPIFSRPEFREIKVVRALKDKAYGQIGSSGSGNHFVEFGIVAPESGNEFGLPAGSYLGLLSHSGSRGLGGTIAGHYTKLAKDACLLPGNAKNLAWLSLDSEAGMEYWLAMNLAGDYASACHHQIHQRMALSLGVEPLAMVENHHNFAWKEMQPDGLELIVHRKGATPAGKGVLGIIPGSMTAPGFIVRGKGEAASLSSAAHGAGRKMSRKKAMELMTKKDMEQYLQKHGVSLIGGGLDESPLAYKNIMEVMKYQKELVEIVGTFSPRVVRMDKG